MSHFGSINDSHNRGEQMTTCPICNSEAKTLAKTGDADGFDCPVHHRFKVAGTVFATRSEASSDQWEAALEKAKALTEPGELPIIIDNFF